MEVWILWGDGSDGEDLFLGCYKTFDRAERELNALAGYYEGNGIKLLITDCTVEE